MEAVLGTVFKVEETFTHKSYTYWNIVHLLPPMPETVVAFKRGLEDDRETPCIPEAR